ncbi:MAG: acetyltransferase [Armatimonadetes bacterium]|nr:acetyltransferase [Armatimonadota bacterium]
MKVIVIGAGGHAKVVISTLQAMGIKVDAVVDKDEKKKGSKILGVPVIGSPNLLYGMDDVKAIIAIGSNQIRKHIASEFQNVEWLTLIHPRAYVHESVKIGEGSVIFAGAIVQPFACIGSHVIINTGATVDHDCEIGNYAHVAPGSHLAGGVKVGEGAFIGIGAVAIPNVHIGDWAIIGAGAVVTADIPSFATAVGVPAKPIKVNPKEK